MPIVPCPLCCVAVHLVSCFSISRRKSMFSPTDAALLKVYWNSLQRGAASGKFSGQVAPANSPSLVHLP
jgi:hypothetical protein